MKIKLIVFSIILFSGYVSAVEHHFSKKVLTVHSPDYRPCLFFRLADVNEADPVTPNIPWFSVPKTHNGFDVINSMLLTAFVTGKEINVETAGTTECGHASVNNIHFAY